MGVFACKCASYPKNEEGIEVINDNLFSSINNHNDQQEENQIKNDLVKRLNEQGIFQDEKISDVLSDINPQANEIIIPHNIISNASQNTYYLKLIKFPNDELYEGGWNKDCEREGYGISINKENIVYKGIWKNNTYGNYGCFMDNKGNYYLGELQNGKAKGKGEMLIKDKWKFIGDFNNDLPCGKGILINFVEGSTYQGNINNGIKEGHGQLRFNDGTIYEGDFKNDKFDGNGKIIYPGGKKQYEGQFHNNKKEGRGILRLEDGLVYEGDFVNDLRHGNGKLAWNENKYYQGKWINDKPHGKGFYYLNGKFLKGTFRFGKIIMES